MKISATRIKMYLTCPRQYRYAYVERLPTTLTPQLAFGQAIHKTLHTLQLARIEGGVTQSMVEAMAEFSRAWQEALQHGQVEFTERSGSELQFVKLAAKIVNIYLDRYEAAPLPLAVEFPFELAWRDHVLCGVIDRIEPGESGLVVVDFKTGKAKPSPKDLHNDLQFTIYAYAAEQVFAVPVEKTVYHHLRSGTELGTERGEDDFRHLREAVLPSVVSGIEGGMFPPCYGFHCKWCDFRERCCRESAHADPAAIAWPESLPDLSELIAV